MKIWFWVCTLFFFYCFFLNVSSAGKSGGSEDLVRTSCVHASYPELCFRTLSTYSSQAKTPNDLAQAAVTVSLSRAGKVSQYLTRLASSFGGEGSSNKKQRLAVTDCVEQLSDSMDELRKTLSELRYISNRTGKFRWHMSNAETWVSAALTDEDTCLDGFHDVGESGGNAKDVKRKMSNVAKVTSNALYLINRLDDAGGR